MLLPKPECVGKVLTVQQQVVVLQAVQRLEDEGRHRQVANLLHLKLPVDLLKAAVLAERCFKAFQDGKVALKVVFIQLPDTRDY